MRLAGAARISVKLRLHALEHMHDGHERAHRAEFCKLVNEADGALPTHMALAPHDTYHNRP